MTSPALTTPALPSPALTSPALTSWLHSSFHSVAPAESGHFPVFSEPLSKTGAPGTPSSDLCTLRTLVRSAIFFPRCPFFRGSASEAQPHPAPQPRQAMLSPTCVSTSAQRRSCDLLCAGVTVTFTHNLTKSEMPILNVPSRCFWVKPA